VQLLREFDKAQSEGDLNQVLDGREPVIFRGLVDQWPSVRAFQHSNKAGMEYVGQFVADRPVTVFVGEKEIGGRFGYNADCSGLNFKRGRIVLNKVITKLLEQEFDSEAPAIYVGSTSVDHWFPGFSKENYVRGLDSSALMSAWMGSKTKISAHFDFPNNLACVVGGEREFILTPPEQLPNLYIGPLDLTPAGQPISLVDLTDIDEERFPKAVEAVAHSFKGVLHPGDAIFIPSMWWHQVDAKQSINLMTNFWWSDAATESGPPMSALMHAILSIRDLPPAQKQVWKLFFEHYIFDSAETEIDYIPGHSRGILDPLNQSQMTKLKSLIVKDLT